MSLSDTAEYWWDVKNRRPYTGRHFTHIPNSTCGHINKSSGNVTTSEYLNDINCFACLELIKQNGNIYNLKEGISPRERKLIKEEARRFRYGRCECGNPMTLRINKSDGRNFLGCTNYPKCKKTKSLK